MKNTKHVSNSCSSSISSLSVEKILDATLYHSIVRAMQYLVITRPDITHVVNRACQAMHNPTNEDRRRVKHLLRYLKGTIVSNSLYHPNSDSSLELFSDADWASSPNDQRSTGGYLIYLGENLISWSTRKQQTVARSSTEVEYTVVADATSEFIWIRYLFNELHLPLSVTPIL